MVSTGRLDLNKLRTHAVEHISKVVKIDVKGLRRRWSSSWSNSASVHARDLILMSTGRLDLNEHRTHAVEVEVRF